MICSRCIFPIPEKLQELRNRPKATNTARTELNRPASNLRSTVLSAAIQAGETSGKTIGFDYRLHYLMLKAQRLKRIFCLMYFLPCGKIILQIRNSVSPQISYPQIEYSLNSREVYGLASNRPVKKVAMRVVADEKDHRKLHLTLNVIQCMKVISGTNRKTDLRQNIQPKTESRSMKISPESHKYKPRPNKNKSTTIIGLYILQ